VPEKPPGADAHLFTDARHVAFRTCYPKYNLELWDDGVPHDVVQRDARELPADLAPCKPDEIPWDALREYFRTAHRIAKDGPAGWRRPKLALALEGGGSKSAPFALGAIAGLHESALLADVDVVSSVSGGSYAAYFYFARLLDALNAGSERALRDPNAWFDDCTPSAYRPRFTTNAANGQAFCSGEDATTDDIRPFANRYPSQAHVRYFQDVIHWQGGLEEVDQSLGDRLSTYANLGVLFAQSLVTAPLHVLGSSLFAGPDNSSPSRLAYRFGIERAYVHTARSWAGATDCRTALQCAPEPVMGEFAERLHARKYTMQDLQAVVANDVCDVDGLHCKGPLWIANAAGSSGRDLTNWLIVPQTDALRANFEMSPYGAGSGLYGFVNRPVDLRLKDVVGSSAAFLDRDQREFGLGATRFLAGVGIHFLNLEWGTDIANYNATDTDRALARITPVPFYHVSAERQRFSPTIHLADGGNTDNLGMLAALRRGAEQVIVVASTGDGTGKMESLCRAKNHLELDGTYRIAMPELADLEKVCNRQITKREVAIWGEPRVSALVCIERASTDFCVRRDDGWHWNPDADNGLGYDMWDWPIPVLSGAVERDDPAGGPPITIARIYLVKPAYYQKAALLQLVRDGEWAVPDRLCALDASWKVDACSAHVNRAPSSTGGVYQEVALPCASIAYAISNVCCPAPGDAHGRFPQHDTVTTTLNSNYTLFGAYYDLARHVVSQIGWNGPGHEWLTVPPSQADGVFAIRPRVFEESWWRTFVSQGCP